MPGETKWPQTWSLPLWVPCKLFPPFPHWLGLDPQYQLYTNILQSPDVGFPNSLLDCWDGYFLPSTQAQVVNSVPWIVQNCQHDILEYDRNLIRSISLHRAIQAEEPLIYLHALH